MVDIQLLRKSPKLYAEAAKNKVFKVDIKRLLELDDKRKTLLQQVETMRQRRNETSQSLKGKKPNQTQIGAGKQLKNQLAECEAHLKDVDTEWLELLKQVPNLPLKDVPIGASEAENVVIKTVGKVPEFKFKPQNHWEIAEARGWLDKERAAKVAGARFAYIKGDLVRLQWALMQFGLSVLTDEKILKKLIKNNNLKLSSKPFTPILPPLMIKTDLYDAMDRLEPRDDRYKIEGEELWLQGSAEHVLGSMHTGEVFRAEELPIRYVGFATSFRKEAGSYGKDMEGIIRMHQFDKLEMESLSDEVSSFGEHLFMIAIQEYLMQKLELPYHVLNKCTADIGKPNARGVDIEVWLPGQNKYRETHTADYMTDYQARRLQTRYKYKNGIKLVHTNDATVFSQRPLIAIIENNQLADGRVQVPKILRTYLGGIKIL